MAIPDIQRLRLDIFSRNWRRYYDLGWPPVPILPDTKAPAISGMTGRSGIDYTASELRAIRGSYGIAIRMPEGVVGIDIDAYDGKPGGKTLRNLETTLGKLPPTFTSSSRFLECSLSGIRFFHIPRDVKLVGMAGPGIDIIQRHHRIAVVNPSVHPKTGKLYEWKAGILPAVEAVPDLPETWLKKLKRKEATIEFENDCIVSGWRHEWGHHKLEEIVEKLKKVKKGSRNNEVYRAAWLAGRLVSRGCLGVGDARRLLQAAIEEFEAKDLHTQTIENGINNGVLLPWSPWPDPEIRYLWEVDRAAGVDSSDLHFGMSRYEIEEWYRRNCGK